MTIINNRPRIIDLETHTFSEMCDVLSITPEEVKEALPDDYTDNIPDKPYKEDRQSERYEATTRAAEAYGIFDTVELVLDERDRPYWLRKGNHSHKVIRFSNVNNGNTKTSDFTGDAPINYNNIRDSIELALSSSPLVPQQAVNDILVTVDEGIVNNERDFIWQSDFEDLLNSIQNVFSLLTDSNVTEDDLVSKFNSLFESSSDNEAKDDQYTSTESMSVEEAKEKFNDGQLTTDDTNVTEPNNNDGFDHTFICENGYFVVTERIVETEINQEKQSN